MVVEPPKSDKRRSVVGGTQRQSPETRNRIEAEWHFEIVIFETTMFRLSHAKQSRPPPDRFSPMLARRKLLVDYSVCSSGFLSGA